jgi:hypothetical protein
MVGIAPLGAAIAVIGALLPLQLAPFDQLAIRSDDLRLHSPRKDPEDEHRQRELA